MMIIYLSLVEDDECELDVLVSLLDDNSDTECVGQHELTDKKSQTTDTAQETTKLLKATANTESTDCTNKATANTESSDWTNKGFHFLSLGDNN